MQNRSKLEEKLGVKEMHPNRHYSVETSLDVVSQAIASLNGSPSYSVTLISDEPKLKQYEISTRVQIKKDDKLQWVKLIFLGEVKPVYGGAKRTQVSFALQEDRNKPLHEFLESIMIDPAELDKLYFNTLYQINVINKKTPILKVLKKA